MTDGREVITQSKLVTIFDVPVSNCYDAEIITPDGKKQSIVVRKYTHSLQVDEAGVISMEIRSKMEQPQRVGWPDYYLLDGKILCCLKRFKMNRTNSFGLNYNLFTLDWKACVILYMPKDKEPELMIANREEWEREGWINHMNQELQIFLGVGKSRNIPLELGDFLLSENINLWIKAC